MGNERLLYVISTKICRSVVSTAFWLSIWPVCGEKNSSNIFSPSFSDMNRKLISLYWSFFPPSGRNCFLQVRRINLKTNICFETFLYVFSSFSDFQRTINGVFCRKTNSSFVKTDYHLSRRFVEQIFLRIGFFCSPLKLERFFSWHSDKNFSAVSSKLLSVCPLQHFMVKIFSVKNVFLPSFSNIQRKFVKCFRNVPGALDETAFYESGGSIWGHNFALTKFFSVFFSCSSELEQRIIGFFSSKNNRKICHNCLPRVRGDILQKSFFDKVFLLFHHRALSDIFRSFRRKFDGPVVSTVYCLSNRTVCGEKIFVKTFFPSFLDIDRKFNGLCSKFFQPSWRNCFLQVRRINLKTNICFENFLYVFSSFSHFERTINGFLCRNINSSFVKTAYHLSRRSVGETFLRRGSFLLFIDTWAVFFWHSDKKFCAMSPKLLCVCPLQQFVVKKNFCQKCLSPIFFGHSAKICLFFFPKLFRSTRQNCILRVQRKNLRTKLCFDKDLVSFFSCSFEIERRYNGFFSSKNNRQFWHNSLPRIQEDFLKNFLWKSSFFDHWAMSDFCMSFRRKSVGPLSVLLSGCQFGQFVVKKNSSNIFSPSFSDMNRKLISLYWSFFGQVDETAFYKSEGSIRRQTSALKILYVFSSFSDFERTINGVFCRKTNSSFVKTDYHLSRRFVEQIFLRIGFFCSPLKLERIFSWHSDKNFSAVSSKLLSVCPLQHFMVKIFSVKNVFLPSFSDIQRKFVKCFLNVPVQLDETAFYESGGSIWGHNFALTKFLFVFFSCSSKLEQRIIGFFSSKNNRKICHNCLPRVQGDLLQKIFFDKVFLLFHHRALSDIFRSFRRKFDGPVVSTVFCLSNRPLCGEKLFVKSFFPSFLDIDRKIIGLCSKFFRPSWRNCFLQARRINLKTNISFENFLYVFSSFSDFEQTINGFLCRNINSSFVKTAYHLSRRSVGETFLRRGSFLLFIDTWAVFFWHSDKKFCAVSPKLLCVCPLQQIVVKKTSVKNVFLPSFSEI